MARSQAVLASRGQTGWKASRLSGHGLVSTSRWLAEPPLSA
jgi:hypothetical protein